MEKKQYNRTRNKEKGGNSSEGREKKRDVRAESQK